MAVNHEELWGCYGGRQVTPYLQRRNNLALSRTSPLTHSVLFTLSFSLRVKRSTEGAMAEG